MTTHFTLFPQLITELRLEIWRLALPTLRSHLLYPYQRGCWVFEDLGLEPDPNGEDLYIRFDTTRLEPIHVALPLYSVNREARDITLKWLQGERMTVSRKSSSVYEALRPFDPRHDAVFVPSTQLADFVVEPAEWPHELEDMVDRHFGTSNPALSRLAVTSVGLRLLRGELLSEFFQFAGTIETILVVDSASTSTSILEALETAPGEFVMQLADRPLARVKCRRTHGVVDGPGDDERALARLNGYVEGLEIPDYSSDRFELEVQLVVLA